MVNTLALAFITDGSRLRILSGDIYPQKLAMQLETERTVIEMSGIYSI